MSVNPTNLHGNLCRSRREARPVNGTLTLRRSSTTPFAQSSQGEPPLPTQSAETTSVQQQSSLSYDRSSNARFSKSQLLDIYRAQQDSDALNGDVSTLFTNTWDPGHSNGANGRGWGKSGDTRDSYGPDVCWNSSGDGQPIGLEETSELEKSVSHSHQRLSQPC